MQRSVFCVKIGGVLWGKMGYFGSSPIVFTSSRLKNSRTPAFRKTPMKLPAATYKILSDAIGKYWSECVIVEGWKAFYADKSLKRIAFDLLYAVTFDLQYDDTHPSYTETTYSDGTPRKVKKRLNPYVPGFDLYAGGCNDTHVFTALKAIIKEHGIWTPNES